MNNFHPIAILAITFFLIAFKQSEATAQQSDLMETLDINLDGIINPYEALDVLLTIQQKDEEGLSIDNIKTLILEQKKTHLDEVKDILNKFDKNKDGKVEISEKE